MISDVIQAVKTVVEALGQQAPYRSVQDLTTEWKIYMRNTYWLEVGNTFEHVNGTYTVTAISCNKWITADKLDPAETFALQGTIAVPALTFRHGPMRRVNQELISDGRESGGITATCPWVYLVEVMSSNQDLEPVSAWSDTGDVRLFILDEFNYKDLQTSSEIYTAVINRTDRITEELIKGFRASPLIGKLSSSRTTNYVNWGTFNEQGQPKKFTEYYFSGTELRIPLPIMKNCNC